MADQRATVLKDEWLRLGAETRLAQIRQELEAIYRVFPHLRKRDPATPATRGTAARKRTFSRKGKLAISEGMRKYWARRKAAAAKTAKAGSKS